MVSHQCEIRDRLEIVEIGTSQHKEIAEHLVAVPIRRQIGKAIEHVDRTASFFLDHFVDLIDKRFKPFFWIDSMNVYA